MALYRFGIMAIFDIFCVFVVHLPKAVNYEVGKKPLLSTLHLINEIVHIDSFLHWCSKTLFLSNFVYCMYFGISRCDIAVPRSRWKRHFEYRPPLPNFPDLLPQTFVQTTGRPRKTRAGDAGSQPISPVAGTISVSGNLR